MKNLKVGVIAAICLILTVATAHASNDSLTIKRLAAARTSANTDTSTVISELSVGTKVLAIGVNGDWVETGHGWIHRSNFQETVPTSLKESVAWYNKPNPQFKASGKANDLQGTMQKRYNVQGAE